MKTVGIIFSKELRRVLFDKKMVFSLYILPIIIMALIYGVMGNMMSKMNDDIENHESKVVIYNCPESFDAFVKEANKAADVKAKITKIDSEKKFKKTKQKIIDGDVDYMIAFDENFEEVVMTYQSGDALPQVKTFYNPSEDYSSSARGIFASYIESYRIALLSARYGDAQAIQVFTVDSDNPDNILQDENKAGGKMLGTMLPYMICILLFAGMMSLGTDTIAGEKERGTLATMLVAPIKRSHIVYGKLLALMVLSAISALVYGASMIVAMPKFMEMMEETGASFHITPVQALLLLAIIVSLVFVYVAIVAACSVLAKNMKEASTYVMPAYMVVIVCGMMTMFVAGDTPTTSYYIPLYGSSMALRNILTMDITNVQALITVGINLVCGIVLAAVVTKLFDNERIMFDA